MTQQQAVQVLDQLLKFLDERGEIRVTPKEFRVYVMALDTLKPRVKEDAKGTKEATKKKG